MTCCLPYKQQEQIGGGYRRLREDFCRQDILHAPHGTMTQSVVMPQTFLLDLTQIGVHLIQYGKTTDRRICSTACRWETSQLPINDSALKVLVSYKLCQGEYEIL